MKFWDKLRTLPFFWRSAFGLLVPFLCAEGLYSLLLKPGWAELGQASLFMGIGPLVSFLLIVGAHRSGWMYRSVRYRWTMLLSSILPALFIFINILVAACFLFVDLRDIFLVAPLLVLACGMTVACGFLLTEGLTERIETVQQTAGRLMAGEVTERVPEQGRDEVAALARVFNQAAERVQVSEQQTQRLNALRSDIVAWAGSDLRTPMMVLKAILEDLKSGEVNDPAAVDALLSTAQAELDVLTQITGDMDEIARLDSGSQRLEMVPYSLGNSFANLIKKFSDPARLTQVAISGQVEPGVDPTWIDAARFNRALKNLVSNALERTPEGGEIWLRAWRAEGAVWVEVQNSGGGFAEQDLPGLFDRFSNAKRSGDEYTAGGSALELSVARSIIQAHQGSIEAHNIDGGARFLIRLTLTPPGIGASRSFPATRDSF